MRTVRAVTMLAFVLGCLVVSAVPAAAADTTISSSGDVTYVPTIEANFGQQTLTFTVTTGTDVAVKVDAEVGGGPVDFGTLGPDCVDDANGINTCQVSAGLPQPQTLSLSFSEADLNSLVLTDPSATVTVTATVAGGGPSATGHINVRPQSDLTATDMHVTGSAQSSFVLGFNLAVQGPSGSASTKVVVTGFRTRPPGTLPNGCVWTGNVTATCTFHGQPNLDNGGPLQFPVLPAQTGCGYRVVLTGLYHDPHPSNNVVTTHGSGPCLATSTTPTATPTATPTVTPTPTATPSGPDPSGRPSVVPSGPATVLAGDTSGSGNSLGQALIALSGVLVLAGLVVAYFGFRRPPGGWSNEPSTQLRR